ncbi:hypothetical protein DFH06DRAFT_312104 [Mycena polygramma]|nr:hypothetical protein DFH06DRAFT_312104 [Mycena polygramma]
MPTYLDFTPSYDSRNMSTNIRSRLMAIEDPLLVERTHLLNSLNSIVHPILTLPPEITSEIFVHYVGGDIRRGASLVASVCRVWRNIALTTPALWSEFHGPMSAVQPRGNLARLLQCQLQRAGSRPLILHISLGEDHEDVLSSIAPYSSQWMSLDLTGAFNPIVFPVGAIRTPLLSLKTLKIQVHRWPRDGPTCVTAFADAPQLRNVELARMSLSQILLPWVQITRLMLWYQSLPEIFEILQQTPVLEDLTVAVHERQVVQLSPLILLRVRRVKLSSAHMLILFTFPALESLEVTHLRAAERTSIQSFLQRSECTIRVLSLGWTSMQDTCDCLSHLPSLTDVTIQYPDWLTAESAQFFHWLSQSENRTILPALEMLYICGGGKLEVGTIAAFLAARRSRADGEPSFKSLKLTFTYKHSSVFEVNETVRTLAGLRTRGLQIDILAENQIAFCFKKKIGGLDTS